MSVPLAFSTAFGWRRVFGGRLTLAIGAGILLFFVLVAVGAPLIAPYDPVLQAADVRLQAPTLLHAFGTDNFGRISCPASSGVRGSIYRLR